MADDWVTGTLGFLERIPKTAFRVSLPLLAVGGAISAAIRLGYIRESSFNGYVADAAPMLLVVGAAIFAVGLIFAAVDHTRKLPSWLARKREARQELQALLENMRFLPTEALIALLDILNQPSGRVPSAGNIPIINALGKMNLLQAESLYSSLTNRGTMLKANGQLMRNRDNVRGYVKTLLVQRGVSLTELSDLGSVSALANKALTKEIEARRDEYGGF